MTRSFLFSKYLFALSICVTLMLLPGACAGNGTATSAAPGATSTPQPTAPEATVTPSPTATAPGLNSPSPTPQLTQVYEFREQDSGKTVTYTITSRFSIILNEQKYPRHNLQATCQPVNAIGTITNVPYVAPPDYVVRYEAVQAGICTIKNGSFMLTVKIITLSS
jgi:hypothetical protein